MIFSPRKDALYTLAIEHGIQSIEEVAQYLPLGTDVGDARIRGWLTRLLKTPKAFAPRRRYVNRFKLGADPEFCFTTCTRSAGGRILAGPIRVDASTIGLAQGPAFGADNNGRLAEIRPWPSRSAVEVVASVLNTLRWLALLNDKAAGCEWECGAYLYDDGLGGHVHFGRKRPTRRQEVSALDSVEEGLLSLGIYPQDEQRRRRAGDARRQIYGALGDFRLQKHGYEYRTYPSWLDSPELAFLTITLSKLAVLKPGLYKFLNSPREEFRIKNFLSYFKFVDDDARLALIMLERGWPKHQGGDFRARWGIPDRVAPVTGIKIVPPSFKPDKASIEEVFDRLATGKILPFRTPEINWQPTAPPRGYRMCIELCNTIQAKGLGELVWDLCVHNSQAIRICGASRGSRPIQMSSDVIAMLPGDWKQRLKNIVRGEMPPGNIAIAPEYREGTRVRQVRRLLLEFGLPIWDVRTCKEDSYDKWLAARKAAPPSPAKKFTGEVVFSSHEWRVGPLAG